MVAWTVVVLLCAMLGTGGVIVDGTSPTLPRWFAHLDGLVHQITSVRLFRDDDSFLTVNVIQECGERPEPLPSIRVILRMVRDDCEDEKENLDHFCSPCLYAAILTKLNPFVNTVRRF